jgi:hypothetical protein
MCSEINSPFWRGKSEKLNIGPDLLSSKPLLTRRDVWGAGYAKLTVLLGQLLSRGSHGLMLSAVLAVEVVLRYVLREQSHCVPNDLTVKERLEGPFEMPHLRGYEEVEKCL